MAYSCSLTCSCCLHLHNWPRTALHALCVACIHHRVITGPLREQWMLGAPGVRGLGLLGCGEHRDQGCVMPDEAVIESREHDRTPVSVWQLHAPL